jgi:hypothetical protein
MQRSLSGARALSPADVSAMQRLHGNRMVSRMLQGGLTVGPADDHIEREADRVAASFDPVGAGRDGKLRMPEGDHAPTLQRQAAAPATGGGGGAPLPQETRRLMETRFGADFGGVRVHTGGEAGQANAALGAEAFTHRNHIYMGGGRYSPRTQSGQSLLAHELTHVVQQMGQAQRKPNKGAPAIQGRLPANRISTKKQKLYLDFLRLKRLDPQFDVIIANKLGMKKRAEAKERESTGSFGHWWTEVGDLKGKYPGTWKPTQSYGWWPKKGVSIGAKVFTGVPGQLNSGSTNDPHHGEAVKQSQMFHPVMELDPAKDDYLKVRTKVLADVKKFAKGYSGKWNWVFGWGKNCHTFQQKMNDAAHIHHQKGAGWFTRPKDVDGIAEAAEKQRAQEKKEAFDKENAGVDFTLDQDMKANQGMMDGPEALIPAGATVRVLTEFLMGGIEKVEGWQKVQLAYNGEYYNAFFEDITKNGKRI